MKLKPRLEVLGDRTLPAVLSFGQYGYVSYPDTATFTNQDASHFQIEGSGTAILYTPSYAQATFSNGNVGNVLFAGYNVSLNLTTTYVYCTGGTVNWTGTTNDDSIVQVSQSYVTATTPNYFVSFSGFDYFTMDALTGNDRYNLYGSIWNENVSWTGNIGTIKHRDGVDTFKGIDFAVVRGGGGADLFTGALPGGSQSVVVGFYSQSYLYSLSITQLFELSSPMTATTDFEKAKVVRNYVNQNSGIGSNSSSWLSLSAKDRFYSVFVSRTENVICGGIAILTYDILQQYGCTARKVYLWDSQLVNSHASCELYDGTWKVVDSTYNFTCRSVSTNLALSYEDMRTQNWYIDASSSGRWRYNYQTYPVPYSSYLAYVVYTSVKPG